MARLSQLAANPQSAPRGDIYLAIASLYHSQSSHLSERERTLMREILQRLTSDVEMAIRIALAERLADDETAPLELILLLADDRIEVARPVILRSRQLSDTDLLSLLDRAGEDHHVACAARPYIGEPVCDALARSDAEPVLVTLVRNATARIAAATFETLVEKSRQLTALHAPLAQRGDLPAPLATRMCEWVSDALKNHIERNFQMNVSQVETRIECATQSIQEPPPASNINSALSAQKLVDKLAAAGQLRAGFLLRVLHQSQIDLFDIAFAKLLDLDLPKLRRIFYEEGPRPVALACRAVGIDRCVFSTVFNLSRQARGARALLNTEDKGEVEAIFSGFTRTEAMDRLRSFAALRR